MTEIQLITNTILLQTLIEEAVKLDGMNKLEQEKIIKKFPSITNKYRHYDVICEQFTRQKNKLDVIEK